jgi:hypothetical protein
MFTDFCILDKLCQGYIPQVISEAIFHPLDTADEEADIHQPSSYDGIYGIC